MEDIVIYKNEKHEMAFEHLYTVGGYATYAVCVKTNYFAGVCNFCIAVETINQYTIEINSVIDKLIGGICVRDCESDAYFEMGFNDAKNFVIKGQLGGSHEINILRFEFSADQTILYGLKRNLLQYLE